MHKQIQKYIQYINELIENNRLPEADIQKLREIKGFFVGAKQELGGDITTTDLKYITKKTEVN